MFLVQECASSGHIKTSTNLFTVLKDGFDCFKIILVTFTWKILLLAYDGSESMCHQYFTK